MPPKTLMRKHRSTDPQVEPTAKAVLAAHTEPSQRAPPHRSGTNEQALEQGQRVQVTREAPIGTQLRGGN